MYTKHFSMYTSIAQTLMVNKTEWFNPIIVSNILIDNKLYQNIDLFANEQKTYRAIF